MKYLTLSIFICLSLFPLLYRNVSDKEYFYTSFQNRYIVHLALDASFKDHYYQLLRIVSEKLKCTSIEKYFKIFHEFEFYDEFKGYCASFDQQWVDIIQQFPEVLHIEQDEKVGKYLHENVKEPHLGLKIKKHHDANSHVNFERNTILTQSNDAPWGISRLSHYKNPFNDLFGYGDYQYPNQSGNNVSVYILDTGIYIQHPEFEGRAIWGTSVVHGPKRDLDGHGTHVAGIIGSKSYGVAKSATLIAVKVLDDSGMGWSSDVIKGLEWVYHQQPQNAVINMSFGGPISDTLNSVVNTLVKAGLHISVAAGNDDTNACSASPSDNLNIYVVGATDATDQIAFFSNTGPCVSLFAPGLFIKSTWNQPDHPTKILSGTSMASPHVAGVIALFLSIGMYQFCSPQSLKSIIVNTATSNMLGGVNTTSQTANKLLSTFPLIQYLSHE